MNKDRQIVSELRNFSQKVAAGHVPQGIQRGDERRIAIYHHGAARTVIEHQPPETGPKPGLHHRVCRQDR